MTFHNTMKVRFGDVDPAGIVFYPRYFEMLNSAVEDWFASMGADFHAMHLTDKMGVPTVKIACEFLAPSFLGDELKITITPTKVGRSSCAIEYSVTSGDSERLRAQAVLVCMNLNERKSMEWPARLKTALDGQCAAPELMN